MYDNYRFIHFLFPLTRIISLSTSSVSSGDYSSGTTGLLDAQSSSRICSSAGFCPVVFTTLHSTLSYKLIIPQRPLIFLSQSGTSLKQSPGINRGKEKEVFVENKMRDTHCLQPRHIQKTRLGLTRFLLSPGRLRLKTNTSKKRNLLK